jgi:eukaryotic-like serine/threonine-protein kinase
MLHSAAAAMTPDPSVGPYRVVRPLGQGGMGSVSLAFDERLKRHVALKSLREDHPGARGRLVREARAAAALSHPGVAGIYDIIEQGDRTVMVLEYVAGRTLAEVLQAGPLPVAEARAVAAQLCDAVAAAHAQGVMHRDLKPGNIMITPDGRVKVLDFGLARQLDSPAQTTRTGDSLARGGLVGTVGYIAPEQIRGAGIDHRCDIYGLGAVLFEMFTGRRPFVERDGLAYALAVTTTEAPRAETVNAAVGVRVGDVLARALARNPDVRYDSARELATALADALDPAPTITVSQPAPPTRRRWPVVSGAALTVAVLAAVAWLLAPRPEPAAPGGARALVVFPAMATGIDAPQAEASGLTGVLTANLSHVRQLNVLTASDSVLTGMPSELAAHLARLDAAWGLLATVRRAAGGLTAELRLVRAGASAEAWNTSITGDAITVQRRLLEDVSQGLLAAGILDEVPAPERARLETLPTSNGDAFLKYAEGQQHLRRLTTAGAARAAVPLFTAAIDLDAEFALAYAGLSDAYWTLYQQTRDPALVASATAAAHQALAIDPAQAAVQLSLATMFSQTGRIEDALQSVDRAIALQPNNDTAFRSRGRILAQAGRIEEALPALDRAIALRPNYATHHETKAFVLYRAGRYAEAAEEYRRVTVLAPDYPAGYQGLGTSLHQLGDTTQAIGNYEHAVRLGPSATAYSNLAYAYYEAGRYPEALKAYQESAARDARRPMVHRNLADVYARLGRRGEAQRAYEAAITAANALLAVNPSDAGTIALVALCEARLGRREAAERRAAEARALRPKDRDILVRAAEVHAILHQPERAIAALSEAIQLGYDRALARRSEELINLRKLPAFVALTSSRTEAPTPGGRP